MMRCLALADQLRIEHGVLSGFAVRSDQSGVQLIERHNFPVFVPTSGYIFDYRKWLVELVDQTSAQALVLDVRDDLPESILEDLSESNVLLVDIDDPSRLRLKADLVFYPPVPQVDKLDWADFSGQLYKGWDWIPLRKEITQVPFSGQSAKIDSLLVTTGGADPAGMAPRIVRLLGSLDKSFDTIVVAGPAFQHHVELQQAIAESSGNFRVECDPDNLPRLMAEADLAIISFGITAYELASIGVPAIYLSLTPDHELSALALANEGTGISLGLFSEITQREFCRKVQPLLESPDLRNLMRTNGRKTVDGGGAARIAKLIVSQIGSERENE